MSESDDSPALLDGDSAGGDAGDGSALHRSSSGRPVSRRTLVAAGVTTLAALAGCGGDGDDGDGGDGGDGSGNATTTMPTADPRLASRWSSTPYRETENGSLVMAVEVENPDGTPREGTVRLHFEYNGTEYEQTRTVSFDGEGSREYELAFPEVTRSEVTSGNVRIYKNVTTSD